LSKYKLPSTLRNYDNMGFLDRFFGNRHQSSLNSMFNELKLYHGNPTSLISMQDKYGIYQMYLENAVLHSIVELSCLAFSRGKYKVTNSQGKVVENSKLLNPFKYALFNGVEGSTEELLWYEFKRQLILYDKVVILKVYKTEGVFNEKARVKILDYLYCNIFYKTTTNIYDSQIIDYIEYSEDSATVKLYPADFTIVTTKTLSKNKENFTLTTIEKQCNILLTAQKVVLTTNRSVMYGVISPKQDGDNSKGGYDTTSSKGLSKDEQDIMQKKFASFALASEGSNSIYVSQRAIDFKSLMPEIQRMMLNENNLEATKIICSTLFFPITSLNYTDSKFSDKKVYSEELYTENIQPSWTIFQNYLNYLYLDRTTDLITIEWQHIQVLQADEEKELNKKVIEGDYLMKINTQIFKKELSFESAVTLLVKQGYNESQAVILLTNQNTIQNGISTETA